MSDPVPSSLDADQCIQYAFDESNKRLRVDAAITAPLAVNGDVLLEVNAEAGDSVLVKGTVDGTSNGTVKTLKVNSDGSINVSMASTLALPSGAATESTLTTLASRIPSGLTVTSNKLIVDGSTVVQPVSGNLGRSWTLSNNNDSVNVGNFPSTYSVTQSTSPWVVSGTVNSAQSGTWNITNISGTITLPTGASTSSNQTTGNNSLASIDSKLTSPLSVSQSGSWTTGRTWALSSSTDSVNAVQSGSYNITNISGTISLPTGASTSANQTTGNTSLSSIDGKLASLGQKTMSGSLPITIASDQSSIPVTQSGNFTIQPLTNSSIVKAQLQDNSGNALNSISNQLQTRDVINTSTQYSAMNVTTSAAEAKGGGSRLTNRKAIWITPTGGTIYWGTNSSVTTSNGTPIFKNQVMEFSFTDNIPIYLIAATTIDTRIVEGS